MLEFVCRWVIKKVSNHDRNNFIIEITFNIKGEVFYYITTAVGIPNKIILFNTDDIVYE